MKKVLFSLLISSSCFAQVFETVPLLQNGDNNKRVVIAVLGDGFTTSEQAAFTTSATTTTTTINYLFTKSPYNQYKNYFNAYAVKVVSTESGVKHPGTATDVIEPVIPVSNPNNYLGSSFDFGVHRCMYSNTTNKVGQVLAANIPDYDITYILGNSTEYGGCGGTYAFVSLAAASNEIVVHELGHSFGELADEYWFAGSLESPNKTQNSNPATIKWKNWIGINGIGINPYTESPTWFRPHENCEMRFLDREFCSVCKETIIEKIHSLVSPVDSFTPANTSSVNASADVTFTVNEILPVPNTLVERNHTYSHGKYTYSEPFTT
ncbi:von Willebrand factor [Chryseobacterium sp. StRB126]|uniref:M64 family metallopeptidase n=1 Tax=Chryseobacterium sp. StRB126 TaxID=878220 RepID=UPI0004E98893|nr:M64 family metallopeptidase [Chryseobacterium sp. StRB126]BAP33613.1 von Willebrand factor [Chryseobacterium sp. StRB126]